MTTKTDVMLERLDSILGQLEALGITAPPAVPVTHLDANGNPGLVAPDELIESAWGNSVATRVVAKYPNRNAIFATSPTAGQLAVALDQNVVWVGTGTAWRPTSMGSTSHFLVSTPGQPIPNGVLTAATWPTRLDDAFVAVNAVGTFNVPSGWGGRWQFDWSVDFPDGSQAGSRMVFLGDNQNRRWGQSTGLAAEGGTRLSGSASVVLPEGGNALVVMYHNDPAGTLTCNATGQQRFQGYYVGFD